MCWFLPQGRVASQEACLYDLKRSVGSGQAWSARDSGNPGKAKAAGNGSTCYGLHIHQKGDQIKTLSGNRWTHYNIIDDSGGAFWPLFGECVEAMGRCTRRQDRRPRSEAKTCMRSLPRFRPDAVSCAPIHAQNRFPSAGSVASHFLKWPWVLLQRSVDVQSVRWWSNGMMGDCHSSDRGSIPRRRT